MTDDEATRENDEGRPGSLKMRIVGAASLLLPFLASIPPLAAWGALMTVPFITYIILMFMNIGSTAIYPLDAINIGINLAVIILLLYTILYLWRRKSSGLVTTGPYRFVRHPQYFSVIVFTTILTYQSVWVLQHTFGIGWLSVDQTIMLWIAMLLVYMAIAAVEELHLEKVFGQDWREYRLRVGFLIPFIHHRSKYVEVIVCTLLPIAFLYATLFLTA